MFSIKVEEQIDLAPFCQLLWKQQLPHRVISNKEGRFLVVGSVVQLDQVKQLYQTWNAMDESERQDAISSDDTAWLATFLNYARTLPVTALVCVLTLFSFILLFGFNADVIGWLSMTPPTTGPGSANFAPLAHTFTQLQLWRLITPVFLHFSLLHLVFDLVLLIYFLQRIETRLGSGFSILAFVLIGVVSNLVQYSFTSSVLFGGLSGVVYGLIGFVMVMQRSFPEVPEWSVNPAFFVAMMIFLVLYSTGVTEVFNLYIANAAHWAGLISGLLLAASVVFRIKGEQRP